MVGFLRTKRGRWTLLAVVCVAALIFGMLAEGFFSSPAPAVSAPDGLANSVSTPPASPLASKSPKKHGGAGDNHLVTNPVQQLRSVLPDNPLNHLPGGELHNVTVSASAGRTIPVLGFLIPTGLGTPYGSVKNHRNWSVSEQALGKGYLAAIFIQSDKYATPVTCTITVDGRVTSSQTTSGQYGRALCLG